MNALERPALFIKPLNSFTVQLFYTSEDKFNVENASGTLLEKGLNLYTFADGYLSLGKRFVAYYQFRYLQNKASKKGDIYRAYGKLKLWKFSFEAGKDNVHLGPGEFALLLSSNMEPFPMIKFQTEESLEFAGKWDFIFVRGWLQDDREDRDDPNIFALRITWKPWDFIEIGGTRAAMYGGEGRPGIKLTEYPKLIIGSEENIPYGKFDGDGYGAYDITLYLPLRKWFRSVKNFKIYYQEGGADISAWWQKEDRGEFYFPFGFKLLDKAYVAGFLLSTERNIFRFEFNRIGNRWYIHHLYPRDGYTYRDLSVGHPYGPNMMHIFVNHTYYFNDKFSGSYRIGFWEQPKEKSETKMKRYYLILSGEKRWRNFITSGFVRADYAENYDTDPSPVRFSPSGDNKFFLTVGTSVSWRF